VTQAQFIKPPNRFAAMTLGGGGKTAGDANREAEAKLEALRPRLLLELDQHLEEIYRRFGKQAENRADEPLQSLYDCALNIIDVAAGLPDSAIDEAARAVCELVSRANGVADWMAIDVHLAALRLLRARGQILSVKEREAVLGGLADVCFKIYGKPEAGTDAHGNALDTNT
jgi:hypothetical protein